MHQRSKINQLIFTKTKGAVIVLSLFLLSLVLLPTNSQKVYAWTAEQQALQSQLQEVQDKINSANQELESKRNAVRTLENEVAILDGEIYQAELKVQLTQSEINLATSQINDLTAQIDKIKLEIKNQKDDLNNYLRVIYEESRISIIEQIASSKNFSDFIDRSEYLQTIQLKIKNTIQKIQDLKVETEKKREEVTQKKRESESLKQIQIAQQQSIENNRAYKQSLLASAQNAANSVESVINDLYAQRQALSRKFNEITYSGSTSYPFGVGNCIYSNDGHGYYIGQCVSYVAWWRSAHGNPVPDNMGDANNWDDYAFAAGLSIDRNPSYGDVMVFPDLGYYGHVAIVEAVNGDGTIRISDMNWDLNCGFRIADNVAPSNYNAWFIH